MQCVCVCVFVRSLSKFDDLCRAENVPLDTPIDEAEGTLPSILKFRQYLHDRSVGNQVAGPGRPRGAATPAARYEFRSV
jgi:hypothetical protein